MRILVMASTFPRWPHDTVPSFIKDLCVSLAARGHEIHVLAPHVDGAEREDELDGIQVHRFRYATDSAETLAYGAGILANLRDDSKRWALVPPFMLTQLSAMVRTARRNRVDLVHAHWVLPQGLVAAAGRRWLDCPVVLTAHGSDVYAMRTGARRRLLTMAARRADALTAVSGPLASELERLTAVSSSVVPMGVDMTAFERDKTPRRMAAGDEGPSVLFVGRLVEQKGVDRLIDAMAAVRRSAPKATLCVVGDGPERPRLEEFAQASGLADAVKFAGPVAHDDIGRYYREADVFVLPPLRSSAGDTEGLSVVALEAAASGLPIVASNMGGIPDVVIDGETGLLVEPGDTDAIAAAIVRLWMDRDLGSELAANARVRASKRYSWEVIAGQFEAVYRSVI